TSITTTIATINNPPQFNNPPLLLLLTQRRIRSHILVPLPHARGVPVAALDLAVGGVAEARVFGGPVGGVVIYALGTVRLVVGDGYVSKTGGVWGMRRG